MSSMELLLPLATVRTSIADFVDALLLVYTLMIIAYILFQLYFGLARGRMVQPQITRPILDFLEQTVGPYLAFFRRFIPQIGMFDFSAIVGILVLQILGGAILVPLIRG